ncbi:HSP20-like chaperone [Sesbania bispinosa]|nr:HSP20-like chaperone [Sesbania bispinosa]
MEDNTLVVSRKRRRDMDRDHKEGVKYLRMERKRGKFLKKFELLENANCDEISPCYQDGVLTVTVHKNDFPMMVMCMHVPKWLTNEHKATIPDCFRVYKVVELTIGFVNTSIASELRGKWQDSRRTSITKEDINVVRWNDVHGIEEKRNCSKSDDGLDDFQESNERRWKEIGTDTTKDYE